MLPSRVDDGSVCRDVSFVCLAEVLLADTTPDHIGVDREDQHDNF